MALNLYLGIGKGKVLNKYISFGNMVILTAEIRPKNEIGKALHLLSSL